MAARVSGILSRTKKYIDAQIAAVSSSVSSLGAPLRVDTAAQGLTDPQVGNALTNLKYALRGDAANGWTTGQTAQARFNIGKSAPLVTTASFTVDANLGIDRQYYFNGAHTATLPASAGLFAGWVTGEFHNLVATSLGTIVPPAGVTLYNGGVSVSSVTIAYGQKAKFLFMPDGTWRTVWIDRCPLLLNGSYSGVGSIDFALPVGYKSFSINASNYIPSTAGDLGLRLSADNGSTVRSGSADYNNELLNGAQATAAAASGTASYIQIGHAGAAGITDGRLPINEVTLTARYGACLTKFGGLSPGNNIAGLTYGAQVAGAAIITPNLVRFFPSAGGTMSLDLAIAGVPSS